MKIQSFSLIIPEGRETSNGYVELPHNTQYSLQLSNDSRLRCDVEVHIDGGHVGTWRIGSCAKIVIERPVHDTGRFTFYRAGTPEAIKAGITVSDSTGLVRATFKPEHDDRILYQRSHDAGGTGLSGRSDQQFTSVRSLDYDTSAFATINLRLVTPVSEPRPLFPSSTPVPPPVR